MRAFTASSRKNSPVLLVHEDGDGNAPGALARQHPIGTVAHHGADAVLGRARIPARRRNGAERKLAQARLVGAQERLVDAGEPLRRGAIDHRRFGAPAMRILVAQRAPWREERAGLGSFPDDRAIGISPSLLSGVRIFFPANSGTVGHERAVLWRRGREFRDCACVPIRNRLRHGPVPCGRTRAGVGRHMFAGQQRHVEIVAPPAEWMGSDHFMNFIRFNTAQLTDSHLGVRLDSIRRAEV